MPGERFSKPYSEDGADGQQDAGAEGETAAFRGTAEAAERADSEEVCKLTISTRESEE